MKALKPLAKMRELREAKGWSRSYFSQLEKIALALGVDPLELVDDRLKERIMVTARQEIETIREIIMRAVGKLSTMEKTITFKDRWPELQIIRDHLYEAVEVLEELVTKNYPEEEGGLPK